MNFEVRKVRHALATASLIVAGLSGSMQAVAQNVSATAGAVAATNPYGLEALWSSSDVVAKTVLMLLLIMSAGSWYILAVKVLERSTCRCPGLSIGRYENILLIIGVKPYRDP